MHRDDRGQSFSIDQESRSANVRDSWLGLQPLAFPSSSARASQFSTLMVADSFMGCEDLHEDSEEEEITCSEEIAGTRTIVAAACRSRGLGRKSMLNERFLTKLEQSKPGAAAWLESSKGVAMQISCIVFFISMDVARPLMYSFATDGVPKADRPIPGVLTGMKNVVAISFSFLLSVTQDGVEGARQCTPTFATVKLIPIATLSTIANISSIRALDNIDPGAFKLFMQLGLVTTGLMSFLVLKRRYSLLQVQALAFALIAIIGFFMSKSGDVQSKERHHEKEGRGEITMQDLVAGAVWTFGCLSCTTLSAVLGERFLVRDPRPYNPQKVQMEVAGLPVSMVVLIPEIFSGFPKGFFVGWNWRLSLAMMQWVVAGWITGLIIKRFSSLTKRLMQGFAAVFTYLLSVIVGWSTPTLLVLVNASLVLQAIMIFFTSPGPEVIKPARDAIGGPKAEVLKEGVQMAERT